MDRFRLRRRALLAAAVIALSALTTTLMLAGCRAGDSAGGPKSGEVARFVGNAACVECHPREFEEHQGSRHDKTLRLATAEDLGDLAPPIGKVDGTQFEVRRSGDGFVFDRWDKPGEGENLEYAFGSGKTGMTYVGVRGEDTAVEMRMSCFPLFGSWYVTPGQEDVSDHALSHARTGDAAKQCFQCHSSAQKPGSIRPMDNAFGVGCESCHGAGGAHIDAARTKGATDLKLEKMENWGAERINRMCGKCHRTGDDISLSGTQVTATHRFQGYGLMQSPCFKKSDDKLSCLTCHDSHSDAVTTSAHYERACLRCHSASKEISPGETARLMNSTSCPVNPKDKCIGCHMPERRVFPTSKAPVFMADHLIWAYGRKSSKEKR